jgi:transcriptional regulator GlxA family with amidase domain
LGKHLDLAKPVYQLCDHLQISHFKLERLFQNVFRKSPSAFHHALRMQAGQKLLSDGRLSVKQVAFQLGYKHANDFSRAFNAFRNTERKR